MGNIAIHGFGRIGRSCMKAALRDKLFTPFSISDIKDLPTLAAIFKADTNYGLWPEDVEAQGTSVFVGGREIKFFDTMKELPDWGALGVSLVVDCTGRATTRPIAEQHLARGAKRVLVSAPSKSTDDCDAVLLRGINMETFDPAKHKIISMASCTTNALAPVVKVLLENWGIVTGFFQTVHAYTNTQSLTDQPMRDRRDSWAAAENIIPSGSGAAKALKFVWPNLNMTGKAYRVPVRTGSIAEIIAVLEKPATVDAVKDAFRKAAATPAFKGVMNVFEEEWASARVLGDSHSSIVDLPLIQILNDTLISVAAWYDNEMGYATRLAEAAALLNK